MTTTKKAYITTTALACCAGENEEDLFSNIIKQQTGITIETNYFQETITAIGKMEKGEIFFEVLKDKCREILQKSDLENFEKTLLIVGSSVGGIHITETIYFRDGNYKNINPNLHPIHALEFLLQQEFQFRDSISLSTACTSSANALGYAFEVIKKGIYDNVLVIGADALSQTTVGGFLSLGVLSSNPCKPFDVQRDGMNVAEGIACLLVQSYPTDKKSVEICGIGYSSDAYHMTHPHPDGQGAQIAMKKALEVARLAPLQIDYINAHGTGTQANDQAEAKAIELLFGNKPLISSTKSITGHTLGAAGAMEAIISKLVINHQLIPTNSFLHMAENSTINLTHQNHPASVQYVMSNSFAFGGNNCSIIFGKRT